MCLSKYQQTYVDLARSNYVHQNNKTDNASCFYSFRKRSIILVSSTQLLFVLTRFLHTHLVELDQLLLCSL